MPISTFEMILDSISMDNIDDSLYFYSNLLDKIMQKKKKYQHNENMLLKKISKLDIKKEILRLKRFRSDSDSDESSDSDIDSYESN
jgi:hypothetical protein